MVPLLTGAYAHEVIGLPLDGPPDSAPLIFKNYSAQGYRTFLAEDNPSVSMFNYLRTGFERPQLTILPSTVPVSTEQQETPKAKKGEILCRAPHRDGIDPELYGKTDRQVREHTILSFLPLNENYT